MNRNSRFTALNVIGAVLFAIGLVAMKFAYDSYQRARFVDDLTGLSHASPVGLILTGALMGVGALVVIINLVAWGVRRD